MPYETIIVERKGPIGLLTLNRPEALNTLTNQLIAEIVAGLGELEKDNEVRVIVVRGSGRAFCAGRDVSEVRERTAIAGHQAGGATRVIAGTIAAMGKPVIAAVHGPAVAGGLGIAASCDLVVASEDAKFGATAINVGLYAFAPSVPLSRSVGRKKALELLLTGDMIDGREAERIGLVNKVVPPEELEEAAMGLAEKLASKSPLALQMGKRSFYTMSDMEYSKALSYGEEMNAILGSTEDAKEGITAFREKRAPQWKGR